MSETRPRHRAHTRHRAHAGVVALTDPGSRGVSAFLCVSTSAAETRALHPRPACRAVEALEDRLGGGGFEAAMSEAGAPLGLQLVFGEAQVDADAAVDEHWAGPGVESRLLLLLAGLVAFVVLFWGLWLHRACCDKTMDAPSWRNCYNILMPV